MEHQNINEITWMLSLQAHNYFSEIRFKVLKNFSLRFNIDTRFVDLVDRNTFNKIEDDRIPFFLGTQFGIYPRIDEMPVFFNGEKLVAFLNKSLLSGHVSGLNIYQILDDDTCFNDFHPRLLHFFK